MIATAVLAALALAAAPPSTDPPASAGPTTVMQSIYDKCSLLGYAEMSRLDALTPEPPFNTIDYTVEFVLSQRWYTTDGEAITIAKAFQDFGNTDPTPFGMSGPFDNDFIDFTVGCVLTETEAPTRVTDHINTTRALDGQQTDEWGDGFNARWTYHPDDGLSITFWNLAAES